MNQTDLHVHHVRCFYIDDDGYHDSKQSIDPTGVKTNKMEKYCYNIRYPVGGREQRYALFSPAATAACSRMAMSLRMLISVCLLHE